MAIDTEAKRKSIAAISFMPTAPVIVPDGTLDKPNRQTIGYSYSGIAAASPGGGSAIPVFIHSYRMRRVN